MSDTVADVIWRMLASAGVTRCYGVVGDSINPVIDALSRAEGVEFIHVRHEEAGVFAAVAEACLTGRPAAVCGTSGPGVMHLTNGLVDAQREGAPVIALAGEVTSSVTDTGAVEELNPYAAFAVASLYTGRIGNPEQTRAVVQTAIRTALGERGPTVIALPGDVSAMAAPSDSYQAVVHNEPVLRPADSHLEELAAWLNDARSVTIFGGDGCRDAHDEVVELAGMLQAPVGYAFRGKQWLEWENPNAVGMSGLLGYGGAYTAMHDCDLCLFLGTNFPFPEFYPDGPRKVQIDRRCSLIGRRTHIDMALTGDIKTTVAALLPLVQPKSDAKHLQRAIDTTTTWRKRMSHYVTRGTEISPIRPEYLVSTLDENAASDAVFTVDTGTACIWSARYITATPERRLFGSFSWGSMANAMPNAIGAALAYPGRQVIALCGDGGLTMLMGDLLTIKTYELPVKLVVLNNSSLGFVHIEMEEAGIRPVGTQLQNPDFSRLAETLGLTGIRLEDPRDVGAAVERLLATPGPALLDAVVDPKALSLPPHISFGMAEGFALSLAKQAIHGDLDEVIATAKANVHLL